MCKTNQSSALLDFPDSTEIVTKPAAQCSALVMLNHILDAGVKMGNPAFTQTDAAAVATDAKKVRKAALQVELLRA